MDILKKKAMDGDGGGHSRSNDIGKNNRNDIRYDVRNSQAIKNELKLMTTYLSCTLSDTISYRRRDQALVIQLIQSQRNDGFAACGR